MDAQTFLAEFGHIANASGGINQLRNLILALAYRGELLENTGCKEDLSIGERLTIEKTNEPRFKKKDKALLPVSDDATDFNIPASWSWQVLGNVGFIFSGNSISKSARENIYANVKEGLPFISTPDVPFERKSLNYNSGLKIPIEEPKFKIAKTDAVLVCSEGGSAGRKVGMAEREICFGNKLFAVEVFKPIYAPYVYNYYQSDYFRKQFNNRMTGIIGGVSLKNFQTISIPLPPLEEQKRIVKKVDELMLFCDKLGKQEEQRQKLQALTRASVLGSIMGAEDKHDFLSSWESMDKHMHLLFQTRESIRELKVCILSMGSLGKLNKWSNQENKRLKDVVSFGPKNGLSPKGVEIETKNKVLTLSATTRGRLDISKTKYIDIELEESSHLFLKKGDILIQRGNSKEYVGVSAIVPENYDSVIYPDLMMKVVCNDSILPEFLHLCLMSNQSREFMWDRLSGTSSTMPKVNKKTVEEIPIRLVSLEDQCHTIQLVEILMSLCDRLENGIIKAQAVNKKLAEAAITTITGIKYKREVKMKAPKTELVTQLKVNVSPTNKAQAPLSAILIKHNGELSAKALFNYSGLEIQDFYQQLKMEMANKWIAEPEKASMRELGAG